MTSVLLSPRRPVRALAARIVVLCACTACVDEPMENEPDEVVGSEWDASEVEAGLEAFAAWVPRVGPDPVAKVARDFQTEGGSRCPEISTSEHDVRWYGDCTTPQGEFFLGGGGQRRGGFEEELATSTPFRALWGPIVSPGWMDIDPTISGVGVTGASYVTLEDRTERSIAGAYTFVRMDVDDVVFTRRRVGAPVVDTDPEGGPDDWVAAGLTLQLDLADIESDAGVFVRTLDGSAGSLDTLWSTVDVLDGLVRTDGSCPEEPEGIWSLRHPDGEWLDVLFDPEDGCDGCGMVFSGDEPVGRACPDLGALLDRYEGEL